MRRFRCWSNCPHGGSTGRQAACYNYTGFIRGILRGVRYAKSLRVLFLHRRSPSWTTLVLYSRVVFIFNEPTNSPMRRFRCWPNCPHGGSTRLRQLVQCVKVLCLVKMPHSQIFLKTQSNARNYRPSFRENKPKTLVLYDWKRAFWACFRENWVYKFGHKSRLYVLLVKLIEQYCTLWYCAYRVYILYSIVQSPQIEIEKVGTSKYLAINWRPWRYDHKSIWEICSNMSSIIGQWDFIPAISVISRDPEHCIP